MRLRFATLVLVSVAAFPAAASARPFDLDGDGRQELVAGVPGWSVRGAPNAGALFVFRGTRAGVAPAPRIVTTDSPSIPGRAEGDDHWGGSMASADFDGDGYADLAVAARGEARVVVLRGSRRGLTIKRTRILRRAGPLAASDLNDDGYGDLVMGAPIYDPSNDDYGSGAIRLFLGGERGLRPRRARLLTRPDRLDAEFGAVLAVADVDADGYPDIVEGAAGDTFDVDESGVPGHVSYCAGTPSGPVECRSLAPELSGGPTSLAIGDVTCDGRADIVAGVPSNRFVGEDDSQGSGAVMLWRGAATGPERRATVVTQRRLRLPRPSQPGAQFGRAVAVAHIDRDGCADVVVGAPGQDDSAGRVVIVRGGRRGPAARGRRLIVQGRSGVPGSARAGHRFGVALGALDLNGDGYRDLAIGAPGDRSVTLLLGTSRGLSVLKARRLALLELGVPVPVDPPRMGATFGGVLGSPGNR